jgi:hypothetical protein
MSDHHVAASNRLSSSFRSFGHFAPAAIHWRMAATSSAESGVLGHVRLVARDVVDEQAGVRIAWIDDRAAIAAGDRRGGVVQPQAAFGIGRTVTSNAATFEDRRHLFAKQLFGGRIVSPRRRMGAEDTDAECRNCYENPPHPFRSPGLNSVEIGSAVPANESIRRWRRFSQTLRLLCSVDST